MKKAFLLLVIVFSILGANAQDTFKVPTYKYYTPYHCFIDFNFKGGLLNQELSYTDLSKNYLNSINTSIGKLNVKQGVSLGGDIQIGYFFGEKKHFGIGIGFLYMQQSNEIGIDYFHTEYQSNDARGAIFRQIITANNPIKESITTTNINIPLVFKYKTQFTKKVGFTVDAGILYNVQIENAYTTNATFNYEAAYLRSSDNGWVYDPGATLDKNDWLITQSNYTAKNPTGNMSHYFDSMQNIEHYNVALKQGVTNKTAAVKYTIGSIGYLLQPAITYRLSERWYLNMGFYYIYQNFKKPVNTNAVLTDKPGNYSSLLNSVTNSVNQTYGVNLGVRFLFGKAKDSDHDGIPDKKDRCPFDSGLIQFLGCPDHDHDGIPDCDDSCPNTWGIAKFHGCPDTDGDGIRDLDDSCPLTPGLLQFHGCPDTDGDGIPDRADSCPTEPGLLQFHGCPDTDGDGIPDKEDACPTKPGPLSNHGCPIDTVAKKKRRALQDFQPQLIHFEFGKTIIKKTSFGYLDSLVEVLNDNPEVDIIVEGHCDTIGSAKVNNKISNSRADAVKKYLLNKGIEPARLVTIGYGYKKPIASNRTKAGRAKNRRAVLKVKFD